MSFNNSQNLQEDESEEMEAASRRALLSCRNKIVKDLDIRLIVDALIESRILDQNLYDQIRAQVIIQLFRTIS